MINLVNSKTHVTFLLTILKANEMPRCLNIVISVARNFCPKEILRYAFGVLSRISSIQNSWKSPLLEVFKCKHSKQRIIKYAVHVQAIGFILVNKFILQENNNYCL